MDSPNNPFEHWEEDIRHVAERSFMSFFETGVMPFNTKINVITDWMDSVEFYIGEGPSIYFWKDELYTKFYEWGIKEIDDGEWR